MTLADRIVLLNEGRIEQVGTPLDLYENPANLFVARFLGSPGINLIPATSLDRTDAETVGIRPERIRLTPDQSSAKAAGSVELVEHLGDTSLVHVKVNSGERLIVKLAGVAEQKRGEPVGLDWTDEDALRFDARGNRLLAERGRRRLRQFRAFKFPACPLRHEPPARRCGRAKSRLR